MPAIAMQILITAGAAGVWAIAYFVALAATRPASPRAAAASPELGAESPAVASLLVNRWQLTEDAAESTLLDLAARRYVELRQPGSDPRQTTVHVLDGDTSALTPYERRVLERVKGLALDSVLPLTALTFRNDAQAKSWTKKLHGEILAETRSRGLSRRRVNPLMKAFLVGIAVLAATVIGWAWWHYADPQQRAAEDGTDGPFAIAAFTLLLLGAVSLRNTDERDTPAGRQVAAGWFGVREWLRGHEAFADLPPASVTVWDRYLAYGAALGTTRLASAVLDLGMGNRRLVWSAYGGHWHRVRVRYPSFWPRYGRTGRFLIIRAILAIGFGTVIVYFTGSSAGPLSGIALPSFGGGSLSAAAPGIQSLGRWLGIALLVYGAYKLLRAVVDLATQRTLTGEVLWLEVWKSKGGGNNRPGGPWLHHLAVDDGSGDRTTAWGLPSELSGQCHDGDIVEIVVRRWSRRVVGLRVTQPGRARSLVESTVEVSAVSSAQARALLTADEVAGALGLTIRESPTGGPMTTFSSADSGHAVLHVFTAQGVMGTWAWSRNSRGTAVPGLSDGFLNGDRAAARVDGTTVLLTLMNEASGRGTNLAWLLSQAASRL